MTDAAQRRAAAMPVAGRLALLLVLALALFLRHRFMVNLDVGWYITMNERVLDGARLYVDAVDTNPPAAIFLYLPWVALARALSLRPALVVDAGVIAAALSSLWLSGRILRATPLFEPRGLLAPVFAAVLLLLPAQTFGEREHFAVILLLPLLAVHLLRACRVSPPWWGIVAAGVAAGLAVSIKPHFVLAAIGTAAAAAWQAKSWRPFVAPENGVAAALAIAAVIVTAIAYPEFFHDIVPLVLTVYVPVRLPPWQLIGSYAVLLWLALLAVTVLLARRRLADAPLSLLLAASCGFALAFAIQGKGWPYHSYPMLALMLCALAVALHDTALRRIRAVALLAAVLLTAGIFSWLSFVSGDARAVAARVKTLRSHPTMLCICTTYSLVHPLVREVDGVWVSRVGSLWITLNARLRDAAGQLDPATRFRLAVYAARDRNMLSEDIAAAKPDIIIVEHAPFDWHAWAAADPVLPRQLQAYREAARIGPVSLLERTGD